MSGNKLLLDTNILIYLSKGELILTDFASINDHLYISVITLMEVKSFTFWSLKEERMVNSLCSMMNHEFIDEAIVEEVIRIRKKVRIKLPDAIIMASALVQNHILVTRNIDDFEGFWPGLKLLNPFDK